MVAQDVDENIGIMADGAPEGEGDITADGAPEGEGDITADGTPEGEGDITADGAPEGEGDITADGAPEGEGDITADGAPEGEGDIMAPVHATAQRSQTLMGIHRRILGAKLAILQREMDYIMPVSSASTEAVKSNILSDLKKRIAEQEYDQEGTLKVQGGVLYQFIVKNNQKSTEHCDEMFTRVYTPLMENFNQPFDDKVNEYMTRAVGPAKQPVFEKRKQEFFNFTTRLVPGPPQNLEAVGRGSNCIKIRWEPPTLQPFLTQHYSVEMRKTKTSGSMWSEVKKTKRMSALVTKLNSDTKYSFRVHGVTTVMLVGNPSEELHTETKFSAAARTATTVAAGVGAGVAAPALVLCAGIQSLYDGIQSKDKKEAGRGVIRMAVSTPVSAVLYPLVAPVFAVSLGAVAYDAFDCEGDLSDSEPSDYEELGSDHEELQLNPEPSLTGDEPNIQQ